MDKNNDVFSIRTAEDELLNEEPVPNLFDSYSQTDPEVLRQLDTPLLEPDYEDEAWGQDWKQGSNRKQ